MKKQLWQDNLCYVNAHISIAKDFLKKVAGKRKQRSCSFIEHWKSFNIFDIKGRLLIMTALYCIFILSCKKEISPSLPFTLLPTPIPISKIRITNSACIFSYSELVTKLGANEILVRGVELSDGTVVNTGNGILSITYKAIDHQEPSSLFRSELNISYNFYGYQQENNTNCWSLGCVYQNAGIPPFTTIIKGSQVLLINTAFYWNIPGGNGKMIKYLVIY